MSTLFRHTRALQASAVAVLLTAAVAALPLLAAEQEFNDAYYADQIVRMFQKTGAENASVYSNAALETSAFDFASYFRHTCYRATDYDMPRCKEAFGPYANLQETYTSGKLASIVNNVTYMRDLAALLPNGPKTVPTPAIQPTSTPATETTTIVPTTETRSDGEVLAADRAARGQAVWKICVTRNTERDTAAGCYQQNIRLIMERTEAITDDMVQ